MVGSGLKKMALKYNLTIINGNARGSIEGYSCALNEGFGYKQMVIDVLFNDPYHYLQLVDFFKNSNIEEQFLLDSVKIYPHHICIRFYDSHGTMDRIYTFIKVFFPIMTSLDIASGSSEGFQNSYKAEIELWQNSSTKNILTKERNIIKQMGLYNYLNTPLDKTSEELNEIFDKNPLDRLSLPKTPSYDQEPAFSNASTSTYTLPEVEDTSFFPGIIGALLGAFIGAFIWIYFYDKRIMIILASIVMAYLSLFGFHLLKGSGNKQRTVSVLISIIIATFTAAVFTTTFQWIRNVYGGGRYFPEWAYNHIFKLMERLFYNPKFITDILYNALLGCALSLSYGLLIVLRINRAQNLKRKRANKMTGH